MKHKIKDILNDHNISLSVFARMLNISRPTLYKFMLQYENGEVLSSPRYQLIFNEIFPTPQLTKKEFMDNLDGYSRLLQAEKILEISDIAPEQSNLIFSIIEGIKKDIHRNNFDEDLYLFIRLVINDPKKNEVIKNFSNYILTLNGYKTITDLSINEQRKLACHHNFFYSITKDKVEYKEEYLDFYMKRIAEIKKNREKTGQNLKKEINNLIDEQIQKELASGKKIEEISISDILQQINQ